MAAISTFAALAGSAIGALGTYTATSAQLSNDRYLERRAEIRSACAAVQSRAYRIDLYVKSSLGRLGAIAKTNKGDPYRAFDAVKEEVNGLSMEHAKLRIIADDAISTASERMLDDAVELALLADRDSSNTMITIQLIELSPKERARWLLENRIGFKEGSESLMAHSAALASTCRKSLQ
ncbi:hypothetical protein [Nonomuraea endophytica]|uniref:Uncharacterized protein n=1 Tax=Nonomuraea endophytica TaxID=714136 RepID=A0A7W8ABD8_9ACTN|nr:hypothetical protein [Nonomuraea endophytica]MBB5083177.1 hypothetical protein [Nonomuraea endophytica]